MKKIFLFLNMILLSVTTDVNALNYKDIKIQKDTFGYEGKRYWIYNDSYSFNIQQLKNNKQFFRTDSSDYSIIFDKDKKDSYRFEVKNLKFCNDNALGEIILQKSVCTYRHVFKPGVKYYSTLRVRPKSQFAFKLKGYQNFLDSKEYEIGAYDFGEAIGLFYGVFDFTTNKWLVRKAAVYKDSSSYLINKLDTKQADQLIDLAIKADQQSKKYYIIMSQMLNIAQGFNRNYKIDTDDYIPTTSNKIKKVYENRDLNKKNNEDNEAPKKLLKKLLKK